MLNGMLASITVAADFLEMSASLWLAFYLLARGYPNRATMRIVLALLAVAAFFLGAYNNFFLQVIGTASLRAVLLFIGMACWYSATFQLLPTDQRIRLRWLEMAVYLLSIVTAVVMVADPGAFVGENKTALVVTPMRIGLTFVLSGCTILSYTFLLPFNILINQRARRTAQGRDLLFASLFPSVILIYRLALLIAGNSELFLRLVQDALTFGGVFMMGLSVARYQSMLERRTILEEFPLTTAIVAGMALLYGLIGVAMGFPLSFLGNLTAFVITSLGVYDLGREVLDRRQTHGKRQFRKQLSTLENINDNQDKVQRLLEAGLTKLCKTLHSMGGFVAVYAGEMAVVVASNNFIPVGDELMIATTAVEELWRSDGSIQNIEWLYSILEGKKQIGLVGIGPSKTKLEYSGGELELFAEFADHTGTIISIGNLLRLNKLISTDLLENSKEHDAAVNSVAEGLMKTASVEIESELVRMVEDALRRFSDFINLGQSPLAEWLEMDGDTSIERGKKLQHILQDAVESLRPEGVRPMDEHLPRIWYSYLVLHDAYVEGASNRDIMARLYISEGTFNRTRRNALRGVARWLAEKFASDNQAAA